MKKRQIIFLVIAFLYLLPVVLSLFSNSNTEVVVPGWDISIDESSGFEHYFLFFLAVSIIYSLLLNINTTFFTLHVILSLSRLLVYLVFEFISNFDLLLSYYEHMQLIDIIFLGLQTICILFLFTIQGRRSVS